MDTRQREKKNQQKEVTKHKWIWNIETILMDFVFSHSVGSYPANQKKKKPTKRNSRERAEFFYDHICLSSGCESIK